MGSFLKKLGRSTAARNMLLNVGGTALEKALAKAATSKLADRVAQKTGFRLSAAHQKKLHSAIMAKARGRLLPQQGSGAFKLFYNLGKAILGDIL